MFNYLIKIEYNGSNFVGWQSQKNGKSIQDTIEKALKKILKSNVRIIGAGRTDKGVHAFGQYANFKYIKEIKDRKKFLDSVNFFLGKNLISIIDIKSKKSDFHARFYAKKRIYEYIIVNRQSPLSVDKNKAWLIKKKIDLRLLEKGGKIFQGTHDFSTFRSASCGANSPIKKMETVTVKKIRDKIYIKFISKSFLQNQVRSMVGCLKYLSTKKWTIGEFKKVFKSKNRLRCAPPAPAEGLYLMDVKY
jgi:tRNA pseudouridine38-40 synthase